MGIIKDCINNINTTSIPVWFMRQAGRYLPEFRDIRSKNPDFIKLCLDPNLSKEITLQTLKRFRLDAAIIFSDILLIPYALGQKVNFKKDFGPVLGDLNFDHIYETSDDDILKKLEPIYELLRISSTDNLLDNKDLIGFVGGTWTLFIYMINKASPKKTLDEKIYKNPHQDKIIEKIIHVQKLHIKKQIENGATLIQVFDSWAGLLTEDKLDKYVYNPTKILVEYIKSLGVEAICFPRCISSYKDFCDIVKPNAINIDYDVNPFEIAEKIDIPIQGGMDPKCLLLDKNEMLKNAKKYLDIFKNNKYIFNLGHGVMPETNPENVKVLVDYVKDFK